MLKQYWDVLSTIIKNNFVREFIYRANTFAMTFTDLVWVAVEFLFFEVIYSNITDINGWSRAETYFFLGIFICSDSLFITFFQRTFWRFPYLVSQGELDTVLTKPISPIFLMSFKDISFTQLLNLFLGAWFIQKFGPEAGFTGGIAWLGVLGWIFIGLITQYMMRFMFVIWSFWLDRAITVSRLYYQLYALANKPEGIYPYAIRYLLKTALPFAFLGSIPARALTDKLSLQEYFFVGLVLVAYFFVCRFFWKRGLMRYQSASS